MVSEYPSLRASEPDAAAFVLQAERHMPLELGAVKVFETRVEGHNLERGIELKKGSECVASVQ